MDGYSGELVYSVARIRFTSTSESYRSSLYDRHPILKVMQEVISLTVFMMFAWWYFGEHPTWRTLVAFLLITVAVALVRGEHEEMAAAPPAPPAAASPPQVPPGS